MKQKRFWACCSERFEEFKRLAKQFSVEIENVYATPNYIWMEYELSVTATDDILKKFEELEAKEGE